jgi:hypothetical protein
VIAIALALEGAKERPLSSAQIQQVTQQQRSADTRTFGGRMQLDKERQEALENYEWGLDSDTLSTSTGTILAGGFLPTASKW